jgi:hypothetical protein
MTTSTGVLEKLAVSGAVSESVNNLICVWISGILWEKDVLIVDALVSSLVAGLLTAYPPVGCVIDCSTWDGKVTTKNVLRFETLDGTVISNRFEYPADTDPSSPRVGFKLWFGHHNWEYEMIGEYQFFVRGSKTAPLRRVVIRPDKPGGWTPTYYFVWAEPLREAPPPRVVNR